MGMRMVLLVVAEEWPGWLLHLAGAKKLLVMVLMVVVVVMLGC